MPAPHAFRSAPISTPQHRTPLDAGVMDLIGRYDHVTQLPNRLQFVDDFADLSGADGRKRLLMLVTLADARHYNEILRALGHAFSEEFVRAGARQLMALLPASLNVYHVSVLSFAFVLDHDGANPPPLAAEIAREFAGPVVCDYIPIKTAVGIGLMPIGSEAVAPAEALRAALTAAQDSRRGSLGFAYYNHRTDAAHIRAFRILADLPAALNAPDQLSLHFQPRINLADGACVGAEALLRWNHPVLGAISPGEFVPLVEQTALINPMTDWVFAAAFRQARALLETGRHLRLSVNASPVNLAEPLFYKRLLALCADQDVSPECIELEFTEGVLAGNFEQIALQLDQLRAAGIEVAIDDFGSGYSNLSQLRRVPADIIKIDQSFIRPIGAARPDDFLVRQIVSMAKGLGFRLCAEGVETREAYDFLQGLGCDEGQGYLMARPMPAAEFAIWLTANS